MKKEIILAKNSGFCFGVKRAAEMAINYEESQGLTVSTLGPLIHNNDVINRLKEHNIDQIAVEDLASLGSDSAVVIRSHGVTPDIISKIEKSGAKMVDATCPFVSTIHKKAKKYHDLGYQIIIVGDGNHPEVIGINGWCENQAIIIRDPNKLDEYSLSNKVCIVAQTTEMLVKFEAVVDYVAQRCKEVITFNTICNATKERQESTNRVSKMVDLMIVIGGKHSSNSKKLYEIAKANCEMTIFIENSSELELDLVHESSIRKIGVTAGASTPDWVIEEVLNIIGNS